jgi:hypothetical protein
LQPALPASNAAGSNDDDSAPGHRDQFTNPLDLDAD